MANPVAVLPLCPVACGSLLARVGDELRAVVIVKATFTLAHERSAWPTTPLPIVDSDAYVAVGATQRLVAATDRTPPLPGTSVVASGTARAPGGRATSEMAVRLALFQGGQAVINKHLRVLGDRTSGVPTPAPFVEMPIVYERAFGGPGVAANPSGVGASGSEPQPNIIDPRDPTRPAGFGPIAPTWAPRATAFSRGLLDRGADGEVLVPPEFDPRALHAAPDDQQLEEPLRGDEWLVLDGFHPDFLRIQTQLPYARAEARVAHTQRPGVLEPLTLTADTLTVDADALLASIIWRGHRIISSAEEASGLRIFVGLALPMLPVRWPAPPRTEALTKASATAREEPNAEAEAWPEIVDTTSERDVRAIRAMLSAQPEEGPTVPLPSIGIRDATGELRVGVVAHAALPFGAAAGVLDIQTPSGSRAPRPSSGTTDVDQARLRAALMPFRQQQPGAANEAPGAPASDPAVPSLASLVADAPAPSIEASPSYSPAAPSRAQPATDVRAAVEERRRTGATLADLRLVGADLSGMDLAGAHLKGLKLDDARLSGANLERAQLQGATLVGADLAGAKLAGADLSGADLSRATLNNAVLDRATLADAKLVSARGEGVHAVEIQAARARFSRGIWDGADFSGAELERADFTGASLGGARFTDARLVEASFVSARAVGAAFDGARLTRAALNSATLTSASFEAADAAHSIWDDGRLEGARLRGASLERARFTRATAARACFASADLRYAVLQRLDAEGIDLERADARGAELRQARLTSATANDANLRGVQAMFADFSDAQLRRADLTGAMLRGANLTAADLTGAKLDSADLREATLVNAVATGASQQGAKLGGAKFEGAVDFSSAPSVRKPTPIE